jgi:hypothetical protein
LSGGRCNGCIPTVIDVGNLSEGRYDGVGIERINGTNVFGDDARKCFAHGILLDDAAEWPSTLIVGATVGGG